MPGTGLGRGTDDISSSLLQSILKHSSTFLMVIVVVLDANSFFFTGFSFNFELFFKIEIDSVSS